MGNFPMWLFPCEKVTCEISHVKFPMWSFPCEISHVKFHIRLFTCEISHVKSYMWNFTRETSHVKFHMWYFTCDISHVKFHRWNHMWNLSHGKVFPCDFSNQTVNVVKSGCAGQTVVGTKWSCTYEICYVVTLKTFLSQIGRTRLSDCKAMQSKDCLCIVSIFMTWANNFAMRFICPGTARFKLTTQQ